MRSSARLEKKKVNDVTMPMPLPGISQEGKFVLCLHLPLGTGNHMSQGFSKDLGELDNKTQWPSLTRVSFATSLPSLRLPTLHSLPP
jgi:hypothetical protein